MHSLGFCRTSIYRWLRDYEDAGLEALVEKIAQKTGYSLENTERLLEGMANKALVFTDDSRKQFEWLLTRYPQKRAVLLPAMRWWRNSRAWI
jgi:transposase